MVLGVILARLLPPDVFGQLAFITASITLMMIPLSISSTQVLVTDGGKTPELFGKVMGLVAITISLKLMVVLLFVLWQLLHGSLENAIVGLLVGLPAALTDWLDVLRADLEGHGRFKPNFLAQFTNLAVSASLGIGLVLLGWGIYGLAVGGAAAFLPQLTLYLHASKRKMKEITITHESVKSQLRVGWWLWLTQISGAIMFRVDKIVLGKLGGETELGYYNRALNYSPFCMLALGSLLTNAAVVALKGSQKENASRKIIFFKMLFIMLAGAIVNWVILYFFSDPLIVWVFGPHWAGSIPVFEAFAWLSLAYVFYYLPMNMLLALDAYPPLAIARITGLLVFCLLLLWFSAHGGLTAVSVAYMLSWAMVLTGIFTGLSGVIWRWYHTHVPKRGMTTIG